MTPHTVDRVRFSNIDKSIEKRKEVKIDEMYPEWDLNPHDLMVTRF